MLRILVQVLVNAIALYVAASIVPGADISRDVVTVLVIALIFGGLNALVRPILNAVTCPAYILTLGLFTFIMNVIILWILQWLSNSVFNEVVISFGDFWSTLLVGIIVSLVSFALNLFVGGNPRK